VGVEKTQPPVSTLQCSTPDLAGPTAAVGVAVGVEVGLCARTTAGNEPSTRTDRPILDRVANFRAELFRVPTRAF